MKAVKYASGILIVASLVAACSSSPPPKAAPKIPTTFHGSNPVSTTHTPEAPPSTSPPTTTTLKLSKLAFFNPRSGYGLFVVEGQTACGASVGFSNDGGAVFSKLATLTTSCSPAASVSALAFDDHGDGFAYGPALYETHDSGSRWSPVPQPGQVLSVAALGLSVWMVEAGCAPSTNPQSPCPLRLFESGDGGITWTHAATPPNLALDNGYSATGGQTWLLRISPSAAYLSSNLPFNSQGSPATDAPLWYTSDGGRTWAARTVACGFPALTDALSVTPDGTLFAVCAGEPGAGNSLKSALRSADGGTSWVVALPCSTSSNGVAPGCSTSPLAGGYLGGIDAVSDTTVFLYGPRSSLLVTHDGGASWSAVMPPIGDTSDGTSTATFFNTTDGIVLGYDGLHDDVNTIWSTSDGGTTWHSVVPVVETTR